MVIYIVFLLIYVGVFLLNVFYRMELAFAIANLLAVFAIVALIVVYQADFKTIFFNLTKKEKGAGNECQRRRIEKRH